MIAFDDVLEHLGYAESPAFLSGTELESLPGYAHVFRQAAECCGLGGVYALRKTWDRATTGVVPIVYVCDAKTELAARNLHRLIWNQNVVPFVIVRAPDSFRLYSGFAFDREGAIQTRKSATSVLRESVAATDFATRIVGRFSARHINDGSVWRNEARFLNREFRVDWKLLQGLKSLGTKLHRRQKLPLPATHALIGKFVFLRYLRDRGILSAERLHDAGMSHDEIFGRSAKLSKLRELVSYLDAWLNGSVFDIPWDAGVKAEHVREVASAFYGDDPAGGQRSLFEDYNFSFVPIETLSVVYEQFLHEKGKARESGAYYTPIPLVNFVLDSMEELQPLRAGMRVLDPSCGSGAFLVQCYRRLIEKELARRKGAKLRPTELRRLLQEHIFGIDRDESACQVAELSLSLTLLDYVDPPDLSNTNFKLPALRGTNVFGGSEEDFFEKTSSFHKTAGAAPFDWIVGNPPWTEISTENPKVDDQPAFGWMQQNEKRYPIGGNQLAELFAWKATEHSMPTGAIGLLLPAMTLFKDESTEFRQRFFASCRVESVVNFANLAYVLFAGRSETPCAAFLYRVRKTDAGSTESIATYAPFVINQEANRPNRFRGQLDTWSIVVNGAELREVAVTDAVQGSALTWKLAMWGSHRDRRLLEGVAGRFTTLDEIARQKGLSIHHGVMLKSGANRAGTKFVPSLVGKQRLVMREFRGREHIFGVPRDALATIEKDSAYLRTRGGETPLQVCEPPHVFVAESRTYAVYSDNYFVIPHPQIGIAGRPRHSRFLRWLSLFLSSDFAFYHQCICSPRWGISINDSSLRTLESLPTPNISEEDLASWMDLHSQLVRLAPPNGDRASRKRGGSQVRGKSQQRGLFEPEPSDDIAAAVRTLNDAVFRVLRLREVDRILIEDFVRCRQFGSKGKAREETAGVPSEEDLESYAIVLAQELDSYFEDDQNYRHRVTIAFDANSHMGMVEIESQLNSVRRIRPIVATAGETVSQGLANARGRVRAERPQWLYFERDLRLYEGRRIYLTKPLQRVHWLRSQALLDADSIIRDVTAQEQ
jgi:hypothetical protein